MTPWKKGRNIVLAILFFLAGVTVASTVRRTADRDYGRLFGEQLPVAPQQVVTRTVPVVTEGVERRDFQAAAVTGYAVAQFRGVRTA